MTLRTGELAPKPNGRPEEDLTTFHFWIGRTGTQGSGGTEGEQERVAIGVKQRNVTQKPALVLHAPRRTKQ